jgi:hypothetical protein
MKNFNNLDMETELSTTEAITFGKADNGNPNKLNNESETKTLVEVKGSGEINE